jgi:glycosyltransferase involved in cell wall biosynthesis
MDKLSIILPVCNEASGLTRLLPKLLERYPHAEVVIVDDGSLDGSRDLCEQHNVRVVSHLYTQGNGAAIKTGARAASGDILVFMDADGQHDPGDVERLLAALRQGYDMVVGARERSSHASAARGLANGIYNRLASWMIGRRIPDLTSGFRVVRAGKFKRFLYLLPNGFSYPTTITMAFFRAGYSVGYVPIMAKRREGVSHIRPLADGLRFLIIIFRIGSLYSPLKLFLPVSAFFFLAGCVNYAYTFVALHRFTNMSTLMMVSSVLVFLFGLVSEQVSALNYRDADSGSEERVAPLRVIESGAAGLRPETLNADEAKGRQAS